MPIESVEAGGYSDVVKWECEPEIGICRDSITLINTDATATVEFPVGTVLGQITATKKWTISKAAAGDGSQAPLAVLVANNAGVSSTIKLAPGEETLALALTRGRAIVSGSALTLGTGTTLSAVTTAFKAATIGITVETTV
jgi:hypothetical protein